MGQGCPAGPGSRVLAPPSRPAPVPTASGTSSAEPRTCSTSSGSSRSPGCPRYRPGHHPGPALAPCPPTPPAACQGPRGTLRVAEGRLLGDGRAATSLASTGAPQLPAGLSPGRAHQAGGGDPRGDHRGRGAGKPHRDRHGPPRRGASGERPLSLPGAGAGWPTLPLSLPSLGWSGGHHASLWQVVADLFEQTFGPPNGSVRDDR